jgi:hypothetical protein
MHTDRSDMKIVLKRRKDGLLYKAPHEWVKDKEEAHIFSSSREAQMQCREENIECIIEWCFPNEEYNFTLRCN